MTWKKFIFHWNAKVMSSIRKNIFLNALWIFNFSLQYVEKEYIRLLLSILIFNKKSKNWVKCSCYIKDNRIRFNGSKDIDDLVFNAKRYWQVLIFFWKLFCCIIKCRKDEKKKLFLRLSWTLKKNFIFVIFSFQHKNFWGVSNWNCFAIDVYWHYID